MARAFAMGIVVNREVGRLRTFQSRLRVARAFAMGTLAYERLDGQSFRNGDRCQSRRWSAKDFAVPPQGGHFFRNGDPGSREVGWPELSQWGSLSSETLVG